ncbi:MAG: trypsin-like peptidase domain-containing protein [Planctomycetota bacterium]|nr:trypsin-like peptidase domain-containing protein [Planctomycetota bacterium]
MRLAAMVLVLAVSSTAGRVFAATENDGDGIATALRAEEELTKAIQKASAAFVFVGGGSGVVVSADGYILTNHHVAGDRKQWTVRIGNTGKLMVCDLVGTDPVGDLTLLRAREAHDLAYVEFGDMAKVRVGQQVMAVGDPFKLADLDGPPSVSLGTVSALHRFQGNYCDAIQTDSAINPGNSGGPLLTLDGTLIGITGQIMSRFGAKANTGIGYAIPVDQIARFYPLLKEAGGKVVYHGTLPDGLTFSNRVDETQAANVEKVDRDSDAEKAGFAPGDRFLSVDGKPVYNYARLIGIVRSYPENATLDIVVERNLPAPPRGRGAPPPPPKQNVPLKVKLPRLQLPQPAAAPKAK